MSKVGETTSVYFQNLDSIRFLAFFLVFLQHGFFNTFKDLLGINPWIDKLILITDIFLRILRIPTESFIVSYISGIFSLFLMILIATYSYKWLEMPLLRLRERFSGIKSKPGF